MHSACFDCSGAAGVMNYLCVCVTCLAERNVNDLQLLKWTWSCTCVWVCLRVRERQGISFYNISCKITAVSVGATVKSRNGKKKKKNFFSIYSITWFVCFFRLVDQSHAVAGRAPGLEDSLWPWQDAQNVHLCPAALFSYSNIPSIAQAQKPWLVNWPHKPLHN